MVRIEPLRSHRDERAKRIVVDQPMQHIGTLLFEVRGHIHEFAPIIEPIPQKNAEKRKRNAKMPSVLVLIADVLACVSRIRYNPST
ncbi:hypothetical protein PBS_36280 [Paraburkholderia sp. 2C]